MSSCIAGSKGLKRTDPSGLRDKGISFSERREIPGIPGC